MPLLWAGEEGLFLPAWEGKHRAPEVFWGSSLLAYCHDVGLGCDFWSKSSTVWLLSLSIGAELLLHPLLKCKGILTWMHWLAVSDLYSCIPVFLWCIPAGIAFWGSGGRWGCVSVAVALLLAIACWAQASLWSIFGENYKLWRPVKCFSKSCTGVRKFLQHDWGGRGQAVLLPQEMKFKSKG